MAQQVFLVARQQVAAQEGPTGVAKPLEEQFEELEEQLEELEEQLEEWLPEKGPKREDFQVLHSGYLIWLSSQYRLQDCTMR